MAEFDGEALWRETLALLCAELGEPEFNDWFADTCFLGFSEKGLTVGFPSTFHRDRVKKSYLPKIRATLAGVAGGDVALSLEVSPKDGSGKPVSPTKPASAGVGGSDTGEPADAGSPASAEIIEIEAKPVPRPTAEKMRRGQHPQLKDDYVFDKYVIGDNNNFAVNAALAISRNPGTNYNPFFIYGGVGLGKTHLMQAIGNHLHFESDKKVIYVTSEDFLNDYLEHLSQRSMQKFKNKYRYVDVLLIDDIQFFAGKEGVQEELFHTFNAVINAKNQIVFTCDRPPSELKKFEARLMSRFEMGLKVDLQPPRYEVRHAILKSVAASRGIAVPDEVLNFISNKISSNVRDLIGSLNTLMSYSELMGKSITLEIAQQKLKDTVAAGKQSNLSIENIMKVVAGHFNVSVNDLKGKKRTQNVVFPRQLAMFLCREMTEFSYMEIGDAFGGRDHSTVIYSAEKIRGRFTVDASIDFTIETIKRQIKEASARM